MENKIIVCSYAVRAELEKKDDELYRFVKEHTSFIQPSVTQQKIVKELINNENFDKWGLGNKDYADPFVVALAKEYNLIVVSEENPRATKNKIPAACRKYRIKHYNFIEFLRAEQIRPNGTHYNLRSY